MSDEKKFEKMMEDLNNEIEKSAKDNAVPSLFPDKVNDLVQQISDLTQELCKELVSLDYDRIRESGLGEDHYVMFKHVFTHNVLKDLVKNVAVAKHAVSMNRSDIDTVSRDTGESVSEMTAKLMMQMLMDVLNK